ncbi:zinc finger CCHC-type containing 7 [Haematobia irritans]|uniref:zinc finger CCHC-type containing 7 n=1 Tax=Haematobia irritans TaxID=7368 RepID=UPI003F4F4EAA
MDEVDIENVEDLNELEARLYAQVHHYHEAGETNAGLLTQMDGINENAERNVVVENPSDEERNVRFQKRYWIHGEYSATKQQLSRQSQQITNKGKIPTQHIDSGSPMETIQTDISDLGRKAVCESEVISLEPDKSEPKLGLPNGANKNAQTRNSREKNVQNLTPKSTNHKSNIKRNPVAEWMKRNGKSNNPVVKVDINSKANSNQGPFFKQQQKLDKAKRWEDKKQKSKKAKVSAKKQNPVTASDIIDLLSSDESDNSDVVVIPVPPPPTFTVDDSDDDGIDNKKSLPTVLHQEEENALDSTDVQMTASSSFIKPQQMNTQNLTVSEIGDKRLENSSRCTSPCSIQSSDDFIGQHDRSRLLETSGMADDEDLLLLTTDVNSLLEKPNEKSLEKSILNKSSAEGVNRKGPSEFTTPKTSSAIRKMDYRVEQTQFKALDVYDSESDITDSVYSKGATKSTVIRQIDSCSSDEVEDITSVTSRTKRLRKRRASSSNKGSDVNYDNTQSSSGDTCNSEDEGDNSGAERTQIPFIARGVAVERKLRKNSRTLSTSSPATSKPSRSGSSKGHMSDGDFIAKLNHLVQGQDDKNSIGDSDEADNAPSAREIAEKILGEREKPFDTAVPKVVCNELNDVLTAIDEFGKYEQDSSRGSDISIYQKAGNNQQKKVVYKTLPNDNNIQIISYVADKTPSSPDIRTPKQRTRNGSPIYNIVYAYGPFPGGGLGWSNEMRKFYQASWNGEDFDLSELWKKMNHDKNIWRIYPEDRFSKSVKRLNNLKCTNCCEFGHARSHCKRPRKPLICYMCGESGHQEPRCPNTICLRCGNKTQVFIKGCNACSFQNRLLCPICKIRGHSIEHCPDKWRRYYATTEPNAFLQNNIVYNTKKYCCICGKRGHLSDVCRNSMHLEYPPILNTVRSHERSYDDIVMKSTSGGIAFNLMYEPTMEYSLGMAEQTAPDRYYGRFLNAVGMGYLMKRKRCTSSNTTEVPAKQSKKQIECNKAICAAPNQVQEISASECADNEFSKEATNVNDDCPPAEEVESTTGNDEDDIQLNVVTPTLSNFSNFKSPNNVTSVTNPPQFLDSDSNYSFSEHFDLPSTSTNIPGQISPDNENSQFEAPVVAHSVVSRNKSRPMEDLPEFIPLVDSTLYCDNEEVVDQNSGRILPEGISNRFVVAESEDEENSNGRGSKTVQSLPDGLPCEAKIYMNNFHSKYLLSQEGGIFLKRCSKNCDLKARLDFTSVGYVLVIFGLPKDQDKFQRELLMKYREIADQEGQKNVRSTPNIPKRTDVLIRFLRDDINQLMSNLGNVNHLYKRLLYVERQQSKSGAKLADKIRRSLNMILVGQAGLQDGNVHLDKILLGLKTLINDYSSEESTPLSLRSEISRHWKFIFSSYRHENYQDLIRTYNNLVLKNRMTRIAIDPLILGNKVLNTSLTAEQKEKMEQSKPQSESENNSSSSSGSQNNLRINSLTPKTSKIPKRKTNQGLGTPTMTHSPIKTPVTQNIRSDMNMSTPIKTKSLTTNATTPISGSRKQQSKILPPPPFANPEKRSTVVTNVQQVSEKCKNTCDTLLKEISKPSPRKGSNVRDSKLPSTFWSRESMRYLDECIIIVSSRPELMEKVRRVQNKSKNGQLSYNDYLAVIKLHTALTGK